MDIEKIKKTTKWDPSKGDYFTYASYERRIQNRKRKRRVLLKILYIIFLILSVILIYLKFK